MGISITPISNRDIEPIINLWNRVVPLDAITLDSLEMHVFLDENFDENAFLVAKENDRTIGFVIGTYARRVPLGDHDPKGDRCWITAFGVDPEHRHHGTAEKLLTSLLQKFKMMEKHKCFIATYAPGYFVRGIDIREYPDAISLLKKLGFSEWIPSGEETYRPLSMDAPLALFKVTHEAEEKERHLLESGITIRTYRRGDLLAFMKFLEANMPADWVRVSHSNLRDLARGIFQPDQIFIAVCGKDEEVIGYCQFEGAHFGPFGVAK